MQYWFIDQSWNDLKVNDSSMVEILLLVMASTLTDVFANCSKYFVLEHFLFGRLLFTSDFPPFLAQRRNCSMLSMRGSKHSSFHYLSEISWFDLKTCV